MAGVVNMAKWYKPKHHTDWRKSQAPETRRNNLMRTTDHRLSRDSRYLQAGRRANALANVTQDRETERKARSDARYFYGRARRTR